LKKYFPLFLRVIVAIVLIQTQRFKFTAHPDSVFIFTKVGLEPNGRIIIGFLELISAILILIPKTVWVGSLLTLGIIGVAILMHLTQLGIEINNDGGLLFITALVTFTLTIVILYQSRKDIPFKVKN
jgi:uncharacterized membrane protein YphA (DoxX/SURF4 family)